MKNHRVISGGLCFAMILVAGIALQVQAQNDKPTYVVMTYIKADRGKNAQYLDLMKNSLSKLWEARVKKGELVSFGLYTVGIRTDYNSDYDFVSVAAANSLKNLLEPAQSTKELLKEMAPNAIDHMLDYAMTETGSIRIVKQQIICKLLDRLEPAESKFIEVQYMKAASGKAEEYVNLEKNVFNPVHKERRSNGEISTWSFWNVSLPSADGRDFDFITVNGINDFDKYSNSDYAAAYKKAFPTGNLTKLIPQVTASRTIVKSEIWRREVYIAAK
jgi:hypothetical protein